MKTPAARSFARTALDHYLAEAGRHPVLSREEERELGLRWIEQKDRAAFDKLVRSNLRFVIKVASAQRNRGIPLEDLIQEGNLGLIQAVEKFDPRRGVRLLTYALWWIRAYLRKYIMRQSSVVKFGTTRAHRRMLSNLGRAQRHLARHSGPDAAADPERIATLLEVDAECVREVMWFRAMQDVSLNAPIGGDMDEVELQDRIPDPSPLPDQRIEEADTSRLASEEVGRALERLCERERTIISGRLLCDDPMTLQDLGERYGISRERARQIEQSARARLQRVLSPAHRALEGTPPPQLCEAA
jgi:RNA polymerase sigma-32 factor